MENETLITFTADVVSAHVASNSVQADELPALIQSVYAAFANLGKAAEVVEEKREPAVSIRSSVKQDTIICLECGFRGKMLKRHLDTEHNLTPAEYKARWNLPADYPIVAPAYAAQRAELAKSIGLGRKVGQKVTKKAAPRKKLKIAVPKAEHEAS